MYLFGASLWFPGFALFNAAGAWGLQIALAIALVLAGMMVLIMLGPSNPTATMAERRPWMVYFGLAMLMEVLCTLTSASGVAKSVQTFGVEAFGWILSLTAAWWFCVDTGNIETFLRGFKAAGYFSGGYAIYQLIGLKVGLPLAFIPLNNQSFSEIDFAMAADLGRANAFTPEPSVLASLLMVMIGMTFADVILEGGYKRYALFLWMLLAFLATSSQSIALLPVFLIVVWLYTRTLWRKPRGLMRSDFVGIGCMVTGMLAVVLLSEAVMTSFSRLTDPAHNESATMRFADVIVGSAMFTARPLVGQGLGSSGIQMDSFLTALGIASASGGITSGFFRVLAEEGIAGLTVLAYGAYVSLPRRRGEAPSLATASTMAALFCFVVATAVVSAVFVGYRNLYTIWLIVPAGLSLNTMLASAKARSRQAPPQTAAIAPSGISL